MPREASLPAEWQCLAGKVHYVQRVNNTEYCCSCPSCGGEIHQNGDLPDRCRLFVDDHPTLFCRKCGLVAYPDQFGDDKYVRPTPEELERVRKLREQAELERKRSAERALAHLRDARLWEQYHEQLNEHGRQLWRGRGLDDAWQSWYGLGYCPNWHGGPTLTIPYFDPRREVLNIKHRLLNVIDQDGKYRYEVSGQPQHLYLTNPADAVAGHVIVVEGEIKAMVTFATLGELVVVGIPGATPPKYMLPLLAKAERITLVMDPGAELEAYKLGKALGIARVRVLIPPCKIDDGIIAAGLTARDIKYIISQAVPVE